MIDFTITFHGPFHVATGVPSAGIDSPTETSVPLPATSLKGLMRAEARDRLGIDDAYVDAIFGRSTEDRNGSPRRSTSAVWAWTDATVDSPKVTPYARIKVDEHGLTERGFLRFGTEVWALTATFHVEPLVALEPEVRDRHRLVLRAAARSVSSLGGDRRRGSGWVSIQDSSPWVAEDSLVLMTMRGTS